MPGQMSPRGRRRGYFRFFSGFFLFIFFFSPFWPVFRKNNNAPRPRRNIRHASRVSQRSYRVTMEVAHEFTGGARALLAGGEYGAAYTTEFGKTYVVWEVAVRMRLHFVRNSFCSVLFFFGGGACKFVRPNFPPPFTTLLHSHLWSLCRACRALNESLALSRRSTGVHHLRRGFRVLH